MNNMSLCDDCIELNENACRKCKEKMLKDLSNQGLINLYNEKQTLIKESCKVVRQARSELAKIIDVVDERAEEENISVVEFYEKYEEKLICSKCKKDVSYFQKMLINGLCQICFQEE